MTVAQANLERIVDLAPGRAGSIPLVDLRAQYRSLEAEVLEVLAEVAQSGTYVLGPHVDAFEEAFAGHVGSRFCVGVNSGTSALHLALICAGVRPGDQVITVPMTFVSTVWAISYIGARPVFVDIDPITYTMDPSLVERKITARTRAILPVHLYGEPADMTPLLEIGRAHDIPIIEDAAQAHGARYCDQSVGSFGLCGCFSFYPGKNLGAYGEAGAVTTDDASIARRIRSLRNHAQSQRYRHVELGFNFRMDAFQGAVLNVKLRYLESWTEARRRLSRRYLEQLSGLPLRLPIDARDRRHVWHLFTVLHPDRDRIRDALEVLEIETGSHYPVPVHLQPAYADLEHAPGDFPVAERVASQCFTLPLFPEMTHSQQDRVIAALHDYFAANPEEGS